MTPARTVSLAERTAVGVFVCESGESPMRRSRPCGVIAADAGIAVSLSSVFRSRSVWRSCMRKRRTNYHRAAPDGFSVPGMPARAGRRKCA